MAVIDRTGVPLPAEDPQRKNIRLLYGTAVGRALLQRLVRPALSRRVGAFLDRPVSKRLIPRFIRANRIDMSDYAPDGYDCFNAFFCRRVLAGRRPVEGAEETLISPCDAKLTVIPVSAERHFTVKGIDYTVETLLRDRALAERYAGGVLLLFRLSVDDYHRYCYPCTGKEGPETVLEGVFHTVNPGAAAVRPIYAENTRRYSLISGTAFGTVLMMEVGAMFVGRIVNDHPAGAVVRGEEKGHFEYGGSTVILLIEKDRAVIDKELIQHSENGDETKVRQGERIGAAIECRTVSGDA